MNKDRLLQFASMLSELPAFMDDLCALPAGVEIKTTRLPEMSRICGVGPVSLLPLASPEHWCWVPVADGVVSVCKTSALWHPDPLDPCGKKSLLWTLQIRYWRQVQEWFGLSSAAVDSVLHPRSYDGPVRVREVVRRIEALCGQ